MNREQKNEAINKVLKQMIRMYCGDRMVGFKAQQAHDEARELSIAEQNAIYYGVLAFYKDSDLPFDADRAIKEISKIEGGL